MTIFLSTGPVISTLLSVSPGAGLAPSQEGSSLMCFVSGAKSGNRPESYWACWRALRWRRDLRVASKFRWRTARKVRASGVRISLWAPVVSMGE